MNNAELEKFDDYTRLFSIYCQGIENHFDNDIPDKDYVCNSLMTMLDLLDNLIESCRTSDNTEKDIASAICDSCDKAIASKSQKELNSHCADCPAASYFERR